MNSTRVISILAMSILALAAMPASAQLVFLDAVDSGNYSWEGNHGSGSENYLAGDSAASGVSEHRNFFVFDLSGVSGTVVRAALSLYNPGDPPDAGNGFNSPDPFEVYAVNEVTTDIATLTAGGSGLVSVFDDLGSGLEYGSVEVDETDNGTAVVFGLNQDGIDAINAAVGGQWAVGGAVTTLAGNPRQGVFAYSNDSMRRQLVLDMGGTIFWDGFETGDLEFWSAVVP